MSIQITLEESQYINLFHVIVGLKSTKKINQIIVCCQAGLNRSQTLAAAITKILIENNICIPVKVVSLEGVPANNLEYVLFNNINSANDKMEFLNCNESKRKTLLSNIIGKKYVNRKIIWCDENVTEFEDLQNSWSDYSTQHPRNLFITLANLPNHEHYLQTIFTESYFINAIIPDLIAHPQQSHLDPHHQMREFIKYKFGLRFEKVSLLNIRKKWNTLTSVIKDDLKDKSLLNAIDFVQDLDDEIKNFYLQANITNCINNATKTFVNLLQ